MKITTEISNQENDISLPFPKLMLISTILLFVGCLCLHEGIPQLIYYLRTHDLPRLQATIIAESEPTTYIEESRRYDGTNHHTYSYRIWIHTITVRDETGKIGKLDEYTKTSLNSNVVDGPTLYDNGSEVETLRHIGDIVDEVVWINDDTLVFSGDISASLVGGLLTTISGIILCALGGIYTVKDPYVKFWMSKAVRR